MGENEAVTSDLYIVSDNGRRAKDQNLRLQIAAYSALLVVILAVWWLVYIENIICCQK